MARTDHDDTVLWAAARGILTVTGVAAFLAWRSDVVAAGSAAPVVFFGLPAGLAVLLAHVVFARERRQPPPRGRARPAPPPRDAVSSGLAAAGFAAVAALGAFLPLWALAGWMDGPERKPPGTAASDLFWQLFLVSWTVSFAVSEAERRVEARAVERSGGDPS